MKRRGFLMLSGAAAAVQAMGWHPVRAQSSMPVVGYLHIGAPGPFARFLGAFKAGLKEGGYVEGENVKIEYAWAEGQADRLPGLAADLVRRGVSVIATGGAERPLFAARDATKTIPIVFVVGADPVQLGVVSNVARPAGNLTGVHILTPALESKSFGLLREMVPNARAMGVMLDPSRVVSQAQADEVRAAAAQAGVRLAIVHAATESDIAPAFAQLAADGASALQVCANPFYNSRRQQIVTLAAHHRLPTIYEFRDFAEAGGLMSYGTDLADGYRQTGVYVARILKGSQPSDLPIMQAARFEFVINLVTAKALNLDISPTLLARADLVIE